MKYYILLLLVVLSSCSKEEEKFIFNGLDYCKKEITINLDKTKDMVYTDAAVFYDKESEKEYVALLSDWDNYLKLFNSMSGQVEQTINIPECPRGFFIESLDSIYVLTETNTVILMNELSEIYKSVKIDSILSLKSKHVALAWPRIPIIKADNSLYFRLSRFEYLQNKFYDSLVVCLAIHKDFVVNLHSKIGTLPIKYLEHDFYAPDESYALNDKNELVFSFIASDSIYIYDSNGSKLKSVHLKSDYISNRNPIDFSMQNPNYAKKAILYADTACGYRAIYYDKYRHLYYRQVLHGQNEYDRLGRKNLHEDREWSIIVSDSNFKVLGEFIFPAREFGINGVFVGKDGLYIPHTHPHSKKYSEDKIVFSVFNTDQGIKNESK